MSNSKTSFNTYDNLTLGEIIAILNNIPKAEGLQIAEDLRQELNKRCELQAD